MNPAIEPKQITLIHIAQGQLRISKDDYRALLLERSPDCWTGSCKDLSYDDASDLIDYFKTLGFKVQAKKRDRTVVRPEKHQPRRGVVQLMSGPQTAKLEHLRTVIKWKFKDGMERMMPRFIGRRWPATMQEAVIAIERFKDMRDTQLIAELKLGADFYETLEKYGIHEEAEMESVKGKARRAGIRFSSEKQRRSA